MCVHECIVQDNRPVFGAVCNRPVSSIHCPNRSHSQSAVSLPRLQSQQAVIIETQASGPLTQRWWHPLYWNHTSLSPSWSDQIPNPLNQRDVDLRQNRPNGPRQLHLVYPREPLAQIIATRRSDRGKRIGSIRVRRVATPIQGVYADERGSR